MYGVISAFVIGAMAAGGPGAPEPCAWSALGRGVDGGAFALTTFDDGTGEKLYAGGAFDVAGGMLAFSVARWDGESWSSLGPGLRSGAVFSLAVFDDGGGLALYAGGSFETSGGKEVRGIARWNGSSWDEVGGIAGGAFKPEVRALRVFDDGSGPALYAGGSFGSIGGEPDTSFIARWDGGSWSSVGGGVGSYVRALAVYDDGSGPALYASGVLKSAGGIPVSHVAKWDGQEWSDVGGGLSKPANALRLFDDGRGPALYAGGSFTSAGGTSANYIARWDGATWSEVGEGFDDTVVSLFVFDNGRGPALYAGGSFAFAGDTSASGIARWDGHQWSALGSGMGGPTEATVAAIVSFDDGEGPALYVGGEFRTAGGIPADRIARWRCEYTVCPADCDRDGSLTFFDFLCFQNLFGAMDPGADCDGSGDLTFFDFLCFQNAFAAGCP